MIIDDLLRDAKMSQYKLSKESGVAQATISDICSRKTTMKNCKNIKCHGGFVVRSR